jgi:NAD(P)-dependent dehydrogenase (short-subunit alcohol dehydrogenase family)
MDLQLTGKRAVIAGASRGIGKQIARRLANEGADVVIGARSMPSLQETADEIVKESGRKVVPLIVDTLELDSVKSFVKSSADALGGIDIMVNCAARVGGARGDVEDVNFDDVLRDFNEKVVGSLRLAQESVPYMKQNGWGRIITISGGAGRSPGTQLSGGARNSALVTVTRAMANKVGPYGINVTVIYPGQTLTEASMDRYNEQAKAENKTVEQVMKELADKNLFRHHDSAEDIANVAAFLSSPLSIGITGEAIAVNGGASTEVHH